jgi:SAM-dependent methyltransferase
MIDHGPGENYDPRVVQEFGREWQRFDQLSMSPEEARDLFDRYFAIFPWEKLPPAACGFDAGCGSGRWARLVAPRVGTLHCIDASPDALRVAAVTLARCPNCRLHLATVDSMPLADETADFGYSLGVLHHIPDTASALRACVRKLKPGAPFLVYLYYAFDNRPAWFRSIWKASDYVRRLVSRSPVPVRNTLADIIALTVYLPLARAAGAAARFGARVDTVPLSAYRRYSFYTMRTDALDRFGTRLEKRFTQTEIRHVMSEAGLVNICFHDGPPYWVALGWKLTSDRTEWP